MKGVLCGNLIRHGEIEIWAQMSFCTLTYDNQSDGVLGRPERKLGVLYGDQTIQS